VWSQGRRTHSSSVSPSIVPLRNLAFWLKLWDAITIRFEIGIDEPLSEKLRIAWRNQVTRTTDRQQ
jgi:hypothetical protein